MSKLSIRGKTCPASKETLLRDIPIGEIFFGRIMHDSVYMRTAAGIVDLHYPNLTWDNLDCPVTDYAPTKGAVLMVE